MSNNAKLSGAEFFRKYTDIMTESISEDLTDNKKYFSILLHVTIDTQGQEVDSFDIMDNAKIDFNVNLPGIKAEEIRVGNFSLTQKRPRNK